MRSDTPIADSLTPGKLEHLRDAVLTLGRDAKDWRDGFIARGESIAYEIKHEPPPPWDRANDRHSPVTEKDTSISDALIALLKTLTPGVEVISEERDAAENEAIRRAGNTYWSIDPIDGTSHFINPARKNYSILIGLVENGRPSFGMTFYPEHELLCYTKGGKAYRFQDGQEQRLRVPGASPLAPPSPAAARALAGRGEAAERMGEAYANKEDHADESLFLLGKAQLGAFTQGGYEWDIAARQAILEAAGGKIVMQETGNPPAYGNNEELYLRPMWLGDPALLQRLGLSQPLTAAGRLS